jgi:putative membrane protein
MIAAWTFGLILSFTPAVDAWSQGWFHTKFTLVILLSTYHGFLARWRRDFEHDRNLRSQRFYRIMNEVPALMMVIIVILAVVKPF